MAEYSAGKLDELPAGSRRIIKTDRGEIGIFNINGRFYALPNRCPHQGGPLCAGKVGGTLLATAESNWEPRWVQEGEVIACPWHGMEFNITTGQCVGRRRVRIRQFPVRVVDGEVWVIL
jgi:nitrite reductase (NADH) small subunit